MRPEAVVFDYGGVLCLPQAASDMEAMSRAAGIDAGLMAELYWKYRAAFDRKDLSTEEYWAAIGRDAGVHLTNGVVEEIIRIDSESWSRPDPVVLSWARDIRLHGLRIAILSNMPITLRRYLSDNARWLSGFDSAIWSCDVNAIKPEPAIYHHVLESLGVRAPNTLFLDDREENIEGARSIGMHAILFENTAQAWGQIRGRYELPPPPSY